MKKVKKVLALVLALCMFTSMTLSVSATEMPTDTEVASEDTISEEQKSDTEEVTADTEDTSQSDSVAVSEETVEADTTDIAAIRSARATGDDPFYKIVHLDAGRKYFTKDWVIALLHEMQASGYNYLELAFGNDGLRFLLDDMSVTANGTTYSDAEVTAGIKAGNKAYSDFGTNEWTQDEMDEIVTAANECGIQIIPLLNTPGHMNAILHAMKSVGIQNPAYSGSSTTVDMANTKAVAFTQALVQKYVTYFAGKGCTIFNIGTDEYANDSGSMGFGALLSQGQYGKFVTYVNDLAVMVTNAGMTPMAFNDGIYYGNATSYGKFNSNILISYWSSGWSGYNVASASFLADQGHRLVNTHGSYYYVLGKNDAYTPGNTTTHDANLYTATADFNNRNFMDSNGLNAAGSMFCIWCDYPTAETETQIAANTRLAIRAMGLRMDDKSIAGMDTASIVTSGFNADGTINKADSGTDEIKEETITLTVGQTESITQQGVDNTGKVIESELNKQIADVVVKKNEQLAVSGYELVTNGAAGIEDGATYLIVNTSNNGTAYALTNSGSRVNVNVNNSKIATVNTAAEFTFVKNGSGYYLKDSNGKYLYPNATRSSYPYNNWTYSLSSAQPNPNPVTVNGNGAVSISRGVTSNVQSTTSYLRYNNNRYDCASNESQLYLFKKVESKASVDTEITFKGNSIGTTYVTVGDVRYTINVIAEDLSKVSPQKVEFWITNRSVTANNATSMTIKATDSTVNSETGAKFSDLVPNIGIQDGNEVVLWKGTRLAADNKQTDAGGVDKTKSGNDFTYIRYWNDKWSYSSDGSQWSDIATTDQIVAYYLQKTEITQEITTNLVDWGPTYSEWKAWKNDWFWNGYVQNGTKFIFLDFAVVYEDGTQNPNAFPVDNTLFYHFDGNSASNPRVLGTTTFTENDEFEIWKVTIQEGTCTGYQSASTFKPTYSGEETIVWDESMGGDPHIDELKYYANRSGKLVRVYVRAKVTEDSLKVHYIDQTAGNNEFYNYNIAVKQGTLFDMNFALGQAKNTLVHNTVVNIKDVEQTVTADLSTMTEIGAQYRYSEYDCVAVKRSTDGKEVYLYYTFNNTHEFVVDFGLPLVITQNDINIGGDWSSATIAGAQYGTADVSVGSGITYTPNKVLQGVESLQLTLKGASGSVTHQIYIYPATTVYYEEGFADSEQFTGGSNGTANQQTAAPGDVVNKQAFNYGRDNVYDTMANSNSQSKVIGDGATFEFTGTGVDIYANCTPNTGMVLIQIKDANGSLKKMMTVDTVLKTGVIDSAHDLANIGTAYNVPIVSVANELDYGKYTVIMKHIKRTGTETTADGILLDGFRVYGTLNNVDDTVYAKDNEQYPQYSEVRNAVLKTLTAKETDSEQYANQIANNIMSQVYATGSGAGALILTKDGTGYNDEQLQDLLDNCSKNELYLYPDQTLVFKLENGTINPQLGLKALNGGVQYSINNESVSLSANTDMFYPIKMGTNVNGTTFTVTNTGTTGILSVTKLKNAVATTSLFAELTEEDLIPALLSFGFAQDPIVEYADATANISLVDHTGKVLATTALTANGEAGTDAVFTADAIKAAAEGVLPNGYAIADAAKIANQTVKYGESADVKIQIRKVASQDENQNNQNNQNPGTTPDKNGVSKTGDTSSALMYILLLGISAIVLVLRKRVAR